MKKKNVVILIIIMTFIILVVGISMYYLGMRNKNNEQNTTTAKGKNVQVAETTDTENELNLATEGNNMIIKTNSKSTIRVINEYDLSLFKGKKSLLIMWGSWCPNCEEELSELEKILEHYKNDESINIVLIAHEYEDTVNDLINLLETKVEYDTEVLLDLGRVIRKKIDPEASTVPVSYLIDKNGNVLAKHNESITLEAAIDMIEKNK